MAAVRRVGERRPSRGLVLLTVLVLEPFQGNMPVIGIEVVAAKASPAAAL